MKEILSQVRKRLCQNRRHNRRQSAIRCECLEPRRLLAVGLGFRDPISFQMGTNPEDLTVADLDGDGLLDLATANFGDNTVTTRFGMGNAQFSAVQHFFVGQGPASIVAADLDGMHGLDLVAGNLLSGDTSVLLSRGGRRFAPEVAYETGPFTEGLAIIDLNEDGVSDILVAAAGTLEIMGQVSALMGDPAVPGAFAPAATQFEKSGTISVVAGHFNQDDSLDLAAATFGFAPESDVSVLLGSGDGTFGLATTMQAGPCCYPLVTADLNGDTHLDLAVVDECSADLSVFLGHGDGGFDAAVPYGVGSWPTAVTVADLDSDGLLDLATANSGDGTVSVLRGQGDGTFAPAVNFAVEGFISGIEAADIDQDGHVDLAVSTMEPNTVQLLLNTADDVTQLRGGGDLYQQDFDARLPSDGNTTGVFLPAEWTAVTAGTPHDTISAAFPPDWVGSETYNAGSVGSTDRTLALGAESDDATSQLRLELTITEQDLHALTLSFDLEVWGGEPGLAADPGEAAFQVALEVDEGDGFIQLACVDTVTTGATLTAPDTILIDGNALANRAHYESSVLDAQVIAGSTLAVAFSIPGGDIGTGFIYGLDNVRVQALFTGDANGDGLFTSSDMVQVFQAGEYEDDIPDNSTFAEGDWNGDGEFTSSDMVMAFQTGLYEVTSQMNASEIAAAVDWLFAQRAVGRKCSAMVA